VPLDHFGMRLAFITQLTKRLKAWPSNLFNTAGAYSYYRLMSISVFESLEKALPNPIFAVTTNYNKDVDPQKVDLGVGGKLL
jgi:hypothetical protein